ncbi:hypothetical protein POM88_054288 [Heracleum sosnowskyi]|uniref:Reverse transcriptase zinc-binding domain-containing protein n=1 Tax=Heracleum sosnowskyi TaxID=360622 RepID=A0AAD8GNU1_9APIA|nr:hypothetical protein POM88_054288 [Heracleum sosnowskyi]
MLNHRFEAMQHLSFVVGENSAFYLWHDPWLAASPLIEYLGFDIVSVSESYNLARVNTITCGRTWTPSSSNHVLVIDLRMLLSTCTISQRDEVLWDGSKKVNLSLIWQSIRRTGNPPPWYDVVWHSFAIPKCAFFTWLALRKRLLTKDRMLVWGMQVNPRCVLCSSANETIEHICCLCPVTYILIRSSGIALSTCWDDWCSGNFLREPTSRVKHMMGLLHISVVIYTVWQERNNRIHQRERPRRTSQLVHDVKRMVREKLFTCTLFRKQANRDCNLVSLIY